jgi:cytochrome c-type biogenesis protein CcmH/NrfG
VGPENDHLTADEIAGLIGFGGPEGLPEERASHAHSCDICGRIITMHQEEDNRLRRLAGGPRGVPGLNCPQLEEWASLAAGLVDPQRRDEQLAHASQCDACGAVLNAVMEDFSEDLTDAESQALDPLQSAQPEWQRNMARRMREGTRKEPIYIRTWLLRAAAVLLAIGAGTLAWNQWRASDPARLMASAYTEQRPFEYRLPGAAFAPVRQQRGGTSSFQRPQALNDAISRIGGELKKNPEDAKWMELSARAEMLERDPEAAIATLQHALEQKPDDPGLLADLGSAYAQRADDQSRAVDYSYAIDYLNRSLQRRPDNAEAVFNLAVVYERMNSVEKAIAEWQHYLKLDARGPWREDAQRRLSALEQKKSKAGGPKQDF